MLRMMTEIMGYTLEARDGEIGRCRDFLFDDEKWTIRYMVADTAKWLPGRDVLISPMFLEEPDWASKRFPVKLNRKDVQEAPPVQKHLPVSRRFEKILSQYYSLPRYWVGGGLWGPYATAPMLFEHSKYKLEEDTLPAREEDADSEENRLRSSKEVTGYTIKAKDGKFGYVDDFILNDKLWRIRYMVVGTRKWLPGRKVLMSPLWIKKVKWLDRKVTVELTKEAVKNSPEYDPASPVNHEYELKLYDYYGRRVPKD
jgi:hypothetical protein